MNCQVKHDLFELSQVIKLNKNSTMGAVGLECYFEDYTIYRKFTKTDQRLLDEARKRYLEKQRESESINH